MRRALITGGNGFIGSHLVDALVINQWHVTVFDRNGRRFDSIPKSVNFIQGDLHHPTLVPEILSNISAIDVVIHLAWGSINESSLQNPATDVVSNLVPSINIIDFCSRNKIKLLFLSSGGAIYGPTKTKRISETFPLNPVSPYGINKLAVEKYLHMYHYLYGLDYIAIRPSVPFGPRQDFLRRQGAVAVFLYRVAKNLPITIWGDGNTVRDYFYIADLVSAMIKCIDHNVLENRIFNVGGSKGITLNQLLEKAEKIVGKKAIVDFQPPRPFDSPQVILDTTLIRKATGWLPQTAFNEGLQQTWNWISNVIHKQG
jgi:UDP-glucose 4-epimerase